MSVTRHIPLSKLQSLIRRRLEEAMPLPCWVTAEISELKVNYSGHCYMELVEKGGDNGIPCARAQAVVWRNSFGMISSYFKSETGIELGPGLNVLLKVSVSYHELYGLSLVVSDVDPLYTVGDLERQRQKTIKRLHNEGVFDMNRALPLPVVLQRIAVVSSRGAAGYQDFMNELAASPFRFEVELFDSYMQGHGTEDSVIDALGKICERTEEFDAVVIIRGGGSQSDLAAFDSYRLCCHIAQFPLPVITGIGHDKDQSIADMVAAVPLKTPTAVAGCLVDSLERVDAWLESAVGELLQNAAGILECGQRRVREAAIRLAQAAGGLTRTVDMRLERLGAALERQATSKVTRERYGVEKLEEALKTKSRNRLASEDMRLRAARQTVEGRDPQRIMALGFAVVRIGGKVLTEASRAATGDVLDITLSSGRLSARVEEAEKQ
ncbi:MAG: exodeoxyribonuclease VII large subunit [Rikenellaceae bacterium]|nr:exodeoxyribonuclease VII large subunit [Rikenellaceae bacterium]